MKRFLLWILSCAGLSLVACDKVYPDDVSTFQKNQKAELDTKSHFLAGQLLFQNLETDLPNIAPGAKLMVTFPDGKTQQEIPIDGQGKFRLAGLMAGDYSAIITYNQNHPGLPGGIPYRSSQLLTIDELQTITLQPHYPDVQDTNAPTLLRVKATDAFAYRLEGCEVCLYSNSTYAEVNNGCFGNPTARKTNAYGYALFAGLEEKNYIVKGSANVGNVVLKTDVKGDQTVVLKRTELNHMTLTLRSQ